MNIIVNGERQTTKARDLAELCTLLGYGGAKIATALNGDFVPASRRKEAALSPDDKIEIVTPRQGG